MSRKYGHQKAKKFTLIPNLKIKLRENQTKVTIDKLFLKYFFIGAFLAICFRI